MCWSNFNIIQYFIKNWFYTKSKLTTQLIKHCSYRNRLTNKLNGFLKMGRDSLLVVISDGDAVKMFIVKMFWASAIWTYVKNVRNVIFSHQILWSQKEIELNRKFVKKIFNITLSIVRKGQLVNQNFEFFLLELTSSSCRSISPEVIKSKKHFSKWNEIFVFRM